MANRPTQSDCEIQKRLSTVARDASARLGEHFESVAIIATYRDSHGRQRSTVWTDGGDYASYGAAKDFVVCAEERMRNGTFSDGEDPPKEGWQESGA